MSWAQRFALVFGGIYLLVGILGFIPPLVSGEIPGAIGGPFTGYLIGLFAVNWFHNLAHLLIGAAGLATYRNPIGASTYALVIGVAYALLFLLGLLAQQVATLGGLLPLNAWDDLLHLLTAAVALGAYFVSLRAAGRAA
jgi:Domain of unknown function (DUF4383)